MILVNNISKSYKRLFNNNDNTNNVLKNISFKINKGDVIGLVGHNGSGKSTLLKILFNLIKEDNGNIVLEDNSCNYHDFVSSSASLINRNERSFFWRLTVEENINFFNSLHKNSISKEDIINKVNFLNIGYLMKKKYGFLSSGEKTKVLILRGLIRNPKIIFFDEIMGSLDINSKKIIIDFIKKINESGVTVVWVTHSLDEIDTLCNRFIIMKDGFINSQKNREEIESLPSEYIYKALV